MNIVITCGHPNSGFQSVHTLLIEAGLAQASVSKRERMTATAFHQRVLSAHGVDLAMPASLSPVTPGRVWDDLAVDLFLGNLDVPAWGWADPGALWLLDFWSQFDAQIRFLLVYASPDLVIGEMLRQGVLSPDSVPQAMASWVACHTELLRFFHRHRDRCLLVDSTAATSMPQRLVTKAGERLGLELDPSSLPQSVETPPQSVLEALLVAGLIPRDTEAHAVSAELEGAADLANDRDALQPSLVQAWGEYGQILARLHEGIEDAQRLRETTARLEREGEEARQGLTRAADEIALQQAAFAEQRRRLDLTLAAQQAIQNELASTIDGLRACEREKDSCTKQLAAQQLELDKKSAAHKETQDRLGEASRRADEATAALKAATTAQDATEARRAESETKAAAATAGNEILLIQVHQMLEELEQHYLRCQTLEEAEKQRQSLETTLATERAKQSGFASEIKQLQARVALGEAVAKQLAAAEKEVEGQVAARKQADQSLRDAVQRTEEISRELSVARSTHSVTETRIRQEADAALADERAKQAELAREIKQLQAQVAQSEVVANQLAAAQKEVEEQVGARKQAEQSLAEAMRRTEELSRKLGAEKSAHNTTEEALKQEAPKLMALTEENDLLSLQLHQVQEELERYYLQCQKPFWSEVPTSVGGGVTIKQLTHATVDMRGEIKGDNWYDAEQDGRWAGPGQISSVMLPALPAGQYQLTLDVVDAVEPEVLHGMVLSLNGKPLAIKRRRRGSLTLVTAKFSAEPNTPDEQWKMELSFPHLLSPAERGSDDHRTLAVRVRTLSLVPIGTESDWPVANASGSGNWGGTQPTQIRFDLRGEIDGDNWYDAEQDGRWAGPGHVSSLMLPALGAGRYWMELDVVDAMAPEIVNGMTLSLNGKPIPVNPKCHGYPTLVTTEFSTDAPTPDGQWELKISFPRVASPADHGSGDHRTLAIRLRTVSIKEIRPGEDRTALQLSGKRVSAKASGKSYRWWLGRK